MNTQPKWTKTIFITGVAALLLGALDPMEGSVLIAAGSLALAVAAHFAADRHRNLFLLFCAFIVTGVIYLFAISSVGGFMGNTGRSWIWGLPILPYPVGWLGILMLLISRSIQNRKNKNQSALNAN